MAYGNSGTATAYGAVQAVGYDAPTASAKTPMIALEMDRQVKATAHLHELVSNLEARISAVLRPVPPDTAGVNQPKPSALVPLAGGLSDTNDAIEGANRRLQAIFERVEL